MNTLTLGLLQPQLTTHVHNVERSTDCATSHALAGAGSGSFSNGKNGEGSRKAHQCRPGYNV